MKKKIALLMACVMAFGVAVGGTLAWLTDSTENVVNTFTDSDINITLEETTGANYQMIPGYTISKNPKVTVEAGSEACWLFVKVKESIGDITIDEDKKEFADYLTYTVGATGVEGKTWTKLTDAGKLEAGETVYYLEVADLSDSATGVTYNVLAENTMSVPGTVTKEMMDAIDGEDTAKRPTLTFTAYAVQYKNGNNSNFTVENAWKESAGYVAPTTP